MREYGPKPLIEEHYYIRELIDAQDKRAKDRIYHQDRVKALEDREKEIRSADGKTTIMFYCKTCKEDLVGEAFKHIEQDWTNSGQTFAFYKTKCFNGHWVVRFIVDKSKDPYFFRSPFIASQREYHHADLLQSFESGYQLMYGK